MFDEVRSVPKFSHQKEKDKPDYKERRYNRKRKKRKVKGVEVFQNRKIPHWKQRGKVNSKDANEALRHYGEACYICGSHEYHLHHVKHKGFGIGGRGVWTNLIPLCAEHHTGKSGVHANESLDQSIKKMHEEKFGPYYFCDMWDLWMKGLISAPEDEKYQEFMKQEEEKALKLFKTQNKNG